MTFWAKVSRFILKQRIFILLVLAAITAFMVTQIKYIQFSHTEANLLPNDHEENLKYDEFLRIFGEEGNMIILAVQDSAIYKVDNFNKWVALTQNLNKYPEVDFSVSVGDIKKLEKDKALIEKRIAIIKQLKKTSSLTVHILDEVANVTPSDRIWLTSLTQSGSALKLAGMALDNRTIAQYMEDLKTSPYISNVNLASSSLKSYAGRNLKAFSLSCSTGVPSEKKAENSEKNKRLK